ncbi:MAG: hypothetical protein LBT59_06385 [Clostridiales bacterium]|jgi:hypothetical protein|nr:hypothetical protein [Clostridiales bacterium]
MTIEEKEEYQAKRREIYNRITAMLDRYLPRGYKKAVLGFFYISRSSVPAMKLYFQPENESQFKDYIYAEYPDQLSEISDLCEELYYLMRKVDDKWTSFTFVRMSSGLFNAKFGYDPIRTVDHMFLLNWRSNYF